MPDATLTVLGRAGAFPQPGEACRGYLLRAGGEQVLVGCGSGVAGRLAWALPEAAGLTAVLLPDLRPDHCSDLWAVGSLAACAREHGRRRGLLPVYAFGEPDAAWRAQHRPGVLDVRRFGAADVVTVGGWRFSFVRQSHPWPGVAVVAAAPGGVRCALVTLGRPGPELASAVAGVPWLLVEVGGPADGLDEGLEGGMGAAEAARLAAEAGASLLLLSHLHPDDDAGALLAEARGPYPRAEWALEARTYELG